MNGNERDYESGVRGYLAYCRRAKADLEAAGSHLDPKYHPTEAGALKLIFHRGDPGEAAKIRQAFREVTGGGVNGSDNKEGNHG